MMEAFLKPGGGRKATGLRQDAQIRRDRLIKAGVELFIEEGIDVPLERIAERAQVGRATLYRNFPDRTALGAAVLQVYIDDLRAAVERSGGGAEAFFAGIRVMVRLTVASHGFEKIKQAKYSAPSIQEAFRRAMVDILAGPLACAKQAGQVRQDFEPAEIPRVALMVAGGTLHDGEADLETAIDRALALLLRGLAASV